jgi:K+-transporting ATPase KdpF subunit
LSGSWPSGGSRKHAIELRAEGSRLRASVMFDYIVSAVVSILLLIYLGWAMFQPEKF